MHSEASGGVLNESVLAGGVDLQEHPLTIGSLALPADLRYGYTLDPSTRTPRAATLSAPDGSWCEIDLTTADDGSRQLREGGPTPLWAQAEDAYQRWHQWGQPTWERFGLTTTADTHAIWLDDPHGELRWPVVGE